MKKSYKKSDKIEVNEIERNEKFIKAYQIAEDQMNRTNLFIKSDLLIQNSHNIQSIMDLRLFNTLIFLITNKEHQKRTKMELITDNNSEYYKLKLKYSELRKILQFNKNKGFVSFLTKSIHNLSQPFEIKDKDKIIITSFLWKSEFEKYNDLGKPEEYNDISFLVDKKMFDKIIFGMETFTILNIMELNSFQSTYATKIAELLIKANRLESIRYFTLSLTEVNKLFQTDYKYITHTRNTLNNAIKKIEETFPELKDIKLIYINNKLVKKLKNEKNIDTEEHIAFIFPDYKDMLYKKPINYLRDLD